MKTAYSPQAIETKWQKTWEQQGTYRQYGRKQKFYVLDMFPYPSGDGLHVGHPKGYIASDVLARMKQLQGYGVLHPMGWDAFGLPAEQYALKHQVHPARAVKKNIATYRKQMGRIGFTYDWDREINTTDPGYYQWTQWIFLRMWERGLVYESHEPINWCPSCQTGLAHEDLENGRCERCNSRVERRPLRQWVLAMTRYADRLLTDLDTEGLEWDESVKEQQRHWIGRSEGAEVIFPVSGTETEIRVYTTRLDTIFGCTYVVLAPEHPLLADLWPSIQNPAEVKKYIKQAASKSDLERTELAKEKTGVKLEGIAAIHPFTAERLSVYAADYVLKNYGTGAVMAVPAHDARDYEFALQYGLTIKKAVLPTEVNNQHDKKLALDDTPAIFTDDGRLVDSGEFSSLSSAEARKKMLQWLQKERLGEKQVHYKMRDWTFSRQRYWGEPIPLVHCKRCGVVPVPERELPVKLPRVRFYAPTGTGESPLAGIASWVNTRCPQCRGPAKRETNTMPQWAGSCWYYLRFLDPRNTRAPVDPKKEKKMMPVDVYVGGVEHATRHLLYARFWHKFLFDINVVSDREPFQKLVNQGLILASDGRKMSKRWGNVINPDDMVARFGADAFRLYEMFMGPFAQAIAWNTDGLVGTRRFLDKVWKLQAKVKSQPPIASQQNLLALFHQTLKKVTEDIEHFKFNTGVSALMICASRMEEEAWLPRTLYANFLILLAPFAPHIAEELWHALGQKRSIFLARWPRYDAELARSETTRLTVQVNGKVRAVLVVPLGSSEKSVQRLALQDPNVKAHLKSQSVRKVIYIPDKVLNLVV